MYNILIGTNISNTIIYLATCHLPPEVGLCKGRFRRWFFNTRCELFIFCGCHGNLIVTCIYLLSLWLYIVAIFLYDDCHT